MWVCFIYFMLLFLALPGDDSGIIKRLKRFIVCNALVLSGLGQAEVKKKDYCTWMFGLIASEAIRTGQYGSS